LTDEPFHELDGALAAALADLPRAQPITILYSGGVDSSVLAHAILESSGVRLLSVGVRGSDDLSAGQNGARLLGAPWVGHEVGEDEVRTALREHGLELLPEPGRSVLASLALALATTPEDSISVAGQGADELFGGYAHFRGLAQAQAELRRVEDWNRLVTADWPATLAIARRLRRRLAAPYLDDRFARAARRIPLRPIDEGSLTKPVFRAWAAHRGVPDAIAYRPKRAIQYGSGIAGLVRKITRVS
jgi:asparagine synthase (glutamine-hydrolysing)